MAEQIIEVTINKAGDAKVDLQGFHGQGCSAIAAAFAEKLGSAVESTTKPEFYEGGGGSNVTLSR